MSTKSQRLSQRDRDSRRTEGSFSDSNSDASDDFESEFGDDSSQVKMPMCVTNKFSTTMVVRGQIFVCSISPNPPIVEPKFEYYREKFKESKSVDLFSKSSNPIHWKWFLDRSKISSQKFNYPVKNRILFVRKILEWTKARQLSKFDPKAKKIKLRKPNWDEESFLLASEAYFIYQDFCKPDTSYYYLFTIKNGPMEIQIEDNPENRSAMYTGKEIVFDSQELQVVISEFSKICENYIAIWNHEIVKIEIVFWKDGFTVQNRSLVPSNLTSLEELSSFLSTR